MDMPQSANQRGAAKAGQSSQHSASAGACLARLTFKLNRAAKRSSIYSRQRAFEVNFPTAISCKSDSLAACHNSKAQQSVTVPYLCQLVQHGNKNRQRVCSQLRSIAPYSSPRAYSQFMQHRGPVLSSRRFKAKRHFCGTFEFNEINKLESATFFFFCLNSAKHNQKPRRWLTP